MALTLKQKQFYEYICQYKAKYGVAPTQKEMKEHFQLKSFGSVQKYLQYLMKEGLIENHWNERRGVEALPLKSNPENFHQLHQSNDYENSGPYHFFSSDKSPLIHVPLLGNIAAGVPILAVENHSEVLSLSTEMFPQLNHRAQYFALKVQGDSMINAGILPGDTALFQHQNHAKPKSIIAAMIHDEVTLKTFKVQGDRTFLSPANDRYKEREITADDHFQILGVMIGLARSYAT